MLLKSNLADYRDHVASVVNGDHPEIMVTVEAMHRRQRSSTPNHSDNNKRSQYTVRESEPQPR